MCRNNKPYSRKAARRIDDILTVTVSNLLLDEENLRFTLKTFFKFVRECQASVTFYGKVPEVSNADSTNVKYKMTDFWFV